MADRARFFYAMTIKTEETHLAYSNITKLALSNSLKKLVMEKPFEKIGIGDICDGCEMNRKSFYYHFHDKYELVIWIFNNEYLSKVKERYCEDIGITISELCKYFHENQAFYKKIISVSGQNCFTEYLFDVCRGTLFAQTEKGKDTVKKENRDALADLFVHSVHGWLTSPAIISAEEFIHNLKSNMLFFADVASRIS